MDSWNISKVTREVRYILSKFPSIHMYYKSENMDPITLVIFEEFGFEKVRFFFLFFYFFQWIHPFFFIPTLYIWSMIYKLKISPFFSPLFTEPWTFELECFFFFRGFTYILFTDFTYFSFNISHSFLLWFFYYLWHNLGHLFFHLFFSI